MKHRSLFVIVLGARLFKMQADSERTLSSSQKALFPMCPHKAEGVRELSGVSFIRALISSLVSQVVKNLPAKQETWVRSLTWEDSLEKGMATHSSILAWRIPWTEDPGRLLSIGLQRVGHLRD